MFFDLSIDSDWSNEIGAISIYKKFGTIAQYLGQNNKNKNLVGAEGFVQISWSISTFALLSLEPVPNISCLVFLSNSHFVDMSALGSSPLLEDMADKSNFFRLT